MKATLSIINTILATIFSGFVFSVLWGWFVVTTFGLPAIGIAAALGILLVARYAVVRTVKNEHEEKVKGIEWAKPLFCLALGYIIKLFM